MTILPAGEMARVRQAMILGLGRQPLTTPPTVASMLAGAEPGADPTRLVLALAAQRLRFDRPAPAAITDVPQAARQMHADSRPLLPPQVRRALVRLSNAVAKGNATQVLQSAVARIVAAGYRPHPFDLPWLMPHIKGNVDCLGLAERAYLALTQKPDADDRPSILHAEITLDNWTEFPKGHRRQFLGRQRANDPAAARAVLEAVFKTEPAPVRAELLEALTVGLGPDDLPFLEGLSGDRADSVKAVAARLLARAPGTAQHSARLTEAAACFQKAGAVFSLMSRIGLGASGEITFVAPKGSAAEQDAVLRKLFIGLSLSDITRATGLSGGQIIEAIDGHGIVFRSLAETATTDGDAATQLTMFEHALLALAAKSAITHIAMLTLGVYPPIPLRLATAETVLASPGWAQAVARFSDPASPTAFKDDGTLLAMAQVLPVEAMPRFLASIEPIPAASREARVFVDLVLALAAPSPTTSPSPTRQVPA